MAWWRLRGLHPAVDAGAEVTLRELGRFGLAAWLTAALSTAGILLMQRWVEAAHGPVDLGRFTMAMLLVQVPLTPVGYAAPLLLRRWMDSPGARASRQWALALFVALLVAAGGLWMLAPRWPDLGLGPAYADATRAVAVLLVGAAGEAASRLLAVHAQALGKPWVAVRAEASRAVVLLSGWAMSLDDGLLTMCAVWSAASLVAAAVLTWHAARGGGADPDHTPAPAPDMAGQSP
jgi:O-antigen/teichoic acid export membrane protein